MNPALSKVLSFNKYFVEEKILNNSLFIFKVQKYFWKKLSKEFKNFIERH